MVKTFSSAAATDVIKKTTNARQVIATHSRFISNSFHRLTKSGQFI